MQKDLVAHQCISISPHEVGITAVNLHAYWIAMHRLRKSRVRVTEASAPSVMHAQNDHDSKAGMEWMTRRSLRVVGHPLLGVKLQTRMVRPFV
jgi:hypothetical protein